MGLLLPHFTLGLGIGILDAALVPLLATIVDDEHSRRSIDIFADVTTTTTTVVLTVEQTNVKESNSDGCCVAIVANYGIVYAVQQMAVSLAYAMAPLLGGLFAQYISFGWLMTVIGCTNVGYAMFMLTSMLRRPNTMLRTNGSDGSDGNEEEAKELTTRGGGGAGGRCRRLEFNDALSKDYQRFYDSVELSAE